MSNYRRNILVGATVLVAGMLFAWMMLRFSSKSAEIFAPPQISIRVNSPRADGLSQGSAVYFLGVSVGRVDNVVRRADGMGVIIDAQVDAKPPIPGNLKAVISQSSAIGGGSSLNLELSGDAPEGQLQPNTELEATYAGLELNLIPPQFTKTAEKIGEMSDEITKTVRKTAEGAAEARNVATAAKANKRRTNLVMCLPCA